jgi:hypothetical protein
MRSTVYNSYKKFKDIKEKPGKLLKQQQFLQTYIDENYDKIDRMLLFHGIGTGKTCTSITIAEKIMSVYPEKKALVILPARLKTNYIDELISSNCGFYKYISKEDLDKFLNSKTSSEEISKIRSRFEKKIEKNYSIISYEKLRSTLVKSENIKKTIKELTNNKIIIIDEVHNLISNGISSETLDKIKKDNKLKNTLKNINGVILRLLTREAEKTCKMFFLTATPVFDNYNQFIELVLNLRPDAKITGKEDIQQIIHLIKGKVSFYAINDRSLFPSVEYKNIPVTISETQDEKISQIKGKKDDSDNYEEKSESFCVKQRQLCISVFNKSKKATIFKNIREYAPKLEVLYGSLSTQPGKHLVYSNFIKYCLELIAEYLKSKGWNDYIKDGSKKNKTFVIWDSSLNDKDKSRVKNVLNSVDNMDGNKIKVILGSPSIKEGISFKHVQQMHQIDPVWNSSAKDQIEGRCIRYKSHEDIPLKHPTLKRHVVITNYIATARDDGEIEQTCDERIYEEIIPAKKFIISKIENSLKKVAFDYFLFGTTKKPTKLDSKSSLISISPDFKDYLKAKNPKKEITSKSCPPARRPVDGKCKDPNYMIKLNKYKEECCYKMTKKDLEKLHGVAEKPAKEKKVLKSAKSAKADTADDKSGLGSKVSRCPANRIPVDGKCKDPDYIVKNKNGRECCYKKTKKDL